MKMMLGKIKATSHNAHVGLSDPDKPRANEIFVTSLPCACLGLDFALYLLLNFFSCRNEKIELI